MSAPGLQRVALRSLKFFARSHLAISLGVAAATAVIVGALVVGDSVRSSLRFLVTSRLDNVQCVLQSREFFAESLLADQPEDLPDGQTVPAILFASTTVEHRSEQLTRASRVQLIAPSPDLWSLSNSATNVSLGEDEIALNESLAQELGVGIDDEITILITDPAGVPSDNPLGRRDDKTISLPRQKVIAILADQSIGGISLVSNQSAPRNVFANLATVQDLLELEDKVNAGFVVSDKDNFDSRHATDSLNIQLSPKLEDYGLKLERHRRVFPDSSLGEAVENEDEPSADNPATIYDYFQLSSSGLIIDDPTADAIRQKLGEQRGQRLLTYLVNAVTKVEPLRSDLAPQRRIGEFAARRSTTTTTYNRLTIQSHSAIGEVEIRRTPTATAKPLSREVPYSIIVGIQPGSRLDLEQHVAPEIGDRLYGPPCLINSWLADEIDAKPGDWLQLDFFQPETVDGQKVEDSIRVNIAGIVPVTEPIREYTRRGPAVFAEAPTIFNDPNLTPSVPGITDQESIENWDLPFPLENEIDAVDDEYWRNHRLTPKIFLPYRYAAWNQMFASRFGNTTAIRFPIPAPDADQASAATAESEQARIDEFEAELRRDIESALLDVRSHVGLAFVAIRDQQLQAASGTTPFDGLFLALSFFVIVAALLLVFLLFKLGLQQRTSELGILRAQGFAPGKVRQLLLREFWLVSAFGTVAGIVLGLGYARAIIWALESWWIGAISTPFLSFYPKALSLALGASIGFAASLIAIYYGLRQACKTDPLDNLRGSLDNTIAIATRWRNIYLAASGMIALAAFLLAFMANGQSGMARAGSFFGSGMLLLVASIVALRQLLEIHPPKREDRLHRAGLWSMAWRAIGRNPSRSLLSFSLLSVASFLIASMSVFQISPSERGYGGFNLLAQSSQPVYQNLGTSAVREERLGIEDARKLGGTTILPMRAKFGEDASCNNLFQVQLPTILGVPYRMTELHDFAPDAVAFDWAGTMIEDNPWSGLGRDAASGSVADPIPVILDQNTAMWSLKQGTSIGAPLETTIDGRTIHFQVVGLLSNSVLQGKLLISQENFQRLFPDLSGYSFFLINSGDRETAQSVAETLEDGWSTEGLDVQYSATVLASYLGVQNTYISAFQSLGALGLLLGTFGLISVQVRSVIERRREFALMRAVGFSPQRLAKLLTMETSILLAGGVTVGIICALVALVPYVWEVGPELSLLSPILMLALVLVIGLLAALVAVRAANRQSVLEGLRSE